MNTSQAIEILTRQFNNKRNLYRMNTEEAKDLAALVQRMDRKSRDREQAARVSLKIIRELQRTWLINLFFKRTLDSAAWGIEQTLMKTRQELADEAAPDPTPFYSFIQGKV